MEKNRSHGKIDRLPESLRKQVEALLLEGHTYREIEEYLQSMGHDISQKSVQRYGKPFLQKFEHVRMAKEFARLLAEDNIDRPTTELHEANNALISQIIMELLIKEDAEPEEKLAAAKAIAALQHAQVANERVKITARKEAGAVHTAMGMLKQQVFEEIGSQHPDVAEAIAAITENVEKQIETVK